MTFLFAFLSFFLADIEPSISNLINDHIGEWEFSVVTPDYTYKGVMELSKEGDAYSGLIISEGVETELKDVSIDGDELTFSMSAQGFECKIKGNFDADSFTGEVMVEGMALPMTAKKVG
jgi:hypothetical protein